MNTSSHPPYIQFLGATGTVTGSKTLVVAGQDLDDRILIDCGLFQGVKENRIKNWEDLPVDPKSLGAVAITHAHLDHSGYLPKLVQHGFASPIYCTRATADLVRIILMDSAHLQEEQAAHANKWGYSKHTPALPLYTTEDALETLRLIHPVDFGEEVRIGRHIKLTFHPAGHILGASMVRVGINSRSDCSILFSGDVGRFGVPILPNPVPPPQSDYYVIESTYGNRLHQTTAMDEEIARVVTQTDQRGGVLLIPAFAIGRTQQLLFLLRELQTASQIPALPIYLDSPMAIRALQAYAEHDESYDDESRYMKLSGDHPLQPLNLHLCSSTEESKTLNGIHEKAIIISASGMATGGRILHHLKIRLPRPEHTVLFIGYQAAGTRGRTIAEGNEEVKIHGSFVPIRCHIERLDGMSAHADQDELLTWMSQIKQPPRTLFLNHGEPDSTAVFKEAIEKKFKWQVEIPEYLELKELCRNPG